MKEQKESSSSEEEDGRDLAEEGPAPDHMINVAAAQKRETHARESGGERTRQVRVMSDVQVVAAVREWDVVCVGEEDDVCVSTLKRVRTHDTDTASAYVPTVYWISSSSSPPPLLSKHRDSHTHAAIKAYGVVSSLSLEASRDSPIFLRRRRPPPFFQSL